MRSKTERLLGAAIAATLVAIFARENIQEPLPQTSTQNANTQTFSPTLLDQPATQQETFESLSTPKP